MKRILSILICAVALASCANSPDYEKITLSVSPVKLVFGQKAETKTIDIMTSEKWTIEVSNVSQGWMTVSPLSGKGKATVKVSVNDIAAGVYHDTDFYVSTDSEHVMVNVIQN